MRMIRNGLSNKRHTQTEGNNMAYDNEIIRSIGDVANRKTPRKLAIADSSKVNHISLSTLEITAGQLGLETDRLEGKGEEGQDVEFLIVTDDVDDQVKWYNLLLSVTLAGTTSQERRALQIEMGEALGYASSDILDFVQSDAAASCKCTCCGGLTQ